MNDTDLATLYPRDQEHWKPVRGFEAFYEVSSLGRVRSLSRPVPHQMRDGRILTRVRKERVLKPTTATGYPLVSTIVGPMYVHRMALEAFSGERPPGMICLHFDDDGTNCWIGNLRWGTYADNADDAKRNGRKIGAPLGNTNRLGGRKVTEKEGSN